MSQQLVADAYDARRQQEISWLTQPTQAPAAGAGGESAPAPAQPTSNAGQPNARPGVMSEITDPFQQTGKQIADAIVSPVPGQAGVPRRLWEFTKGIGNATMVVPQALGNLVGHAVSSLDEVAGGMTDAALDQRIEQARQNAPGELPFYQQLRALPY